MIRESLSIFEQRCADEVAEKFRKPYTGKRRNPYTEVGAQKSRFAITPGTCARNASASVIAMPRRAASFMFDFSRGRDLCGI